MTIEVHVARCLWHQLRSNDNFDAVALHFRVGEEKVAQQRQKYSANSSSPSPMTLNSMTCKNAMAQPVALDGGAVSTGRHTGPDPEPVIILDYSYPN
jgi:hypothetical protein